MKLRCGFLVLLWTILLSVALVSCTPAPRETIPLASFTESYVEVSIYLELDPEGKYMLAATFKPPDGYHLYSKDIPLEGVNGLGRPTLLELSPDSHTKTTGALLENLEAEMPDFEPRELLVYPDGAVTLSLPVELPSGSGWVEDEVQVTYMACSASQCKPPVVRKNVLVPIPSTDTLEPE